MVRLVRTSLILTCNQSSLSLSLVEEIVIIIVVALKSELVSEEESSLRSKLKESLILISLLANNNFVAILHPR